ncbi:MAG: NUDIX domain-containing protein [Deltaproteobacteria bacterium]|nr:NUDIX domain-containing protein [Deltaproteobacteria bacterium]
MNFPIERPRAAVSAVIMNPEKKVLLTLRSSKVWWPGQWCLPGGHLRGGQDWLSTCREEVSEEVGLEVVKARLVGIYSDPEVNQLWEPRAGKKLSFVVASFLVTDYRGEVKVNDEVSEVGWFELDRLPTPLLVSEKIKISDAFRFDGQAFVR